MRKGWVRKTVDEVCQFRGGGTPSRSVERYWRGEIPWVSPKDMKFDVVSDSIDHISQEAMDRSATSLIPKGSVLVVVRSGILARTVPIAIAGRDLTINQDLKALCPDRSVDSRFLYHLLGSRMAELLSMVSRSATVHRLATEQIRGLQFALPPLSEQRRIVALLDEAFAGLAIAKANAERNLLNARALFESHLQSVFAQREKEWFKTTVGEQLTLQRGFDITKGLQRDGIVPVVSSGGIKSFHDKAMAEGPGVVIGRKGTLGKVFYIESDYWPHDTTLWVKDFKFNEPRFVYYFLLGLDVKRLDSGSANPALNRNQVHPISLHWPPVARQKAIVRTLDALQEGVQQLSSIYERKLLSLDTLKNSLLQRAFSGGLF